ncbi:MAG: GNAT family N-acetyltransferase [Polyangiaceae bacterium]
MLLFASTRGAELSILRGDVAGSEGLSPAQEVFVRVQMRAQTLGYQAAYPRAVREIVLASGEPVGRWIVDRAGDAVRLVDVALLPRHRGRGLGTALITSLLREAERQGRNVRLSVMRGNPAAQLYLRLGFEFLDSEGDGVRDAMEWRPGRNDDAG